MHHWEDLPSGGQTREGCALARKWSREEILESRILGVWLGGSYIASGLARSLGHMNCSIWGERVCLEERQKESLNQSFSEYNLWTSSISSTWNLLEMQVFRPNPGPTESQSAFKSILRNPFTHHDLGSLAKHRTPGRGHGCLDLKVVFTLTPGSTSGIIFLPSHVEPCEDIGTGSPANI